MPAFDPTDCRGQFPGLARQVNGRPAVFFDGPAGSQVPARVAAAVAGYLTGCNANEGGLFATSRESDALLAEAHRAVADLLGSDDPDTVVFGPNMTTLTFALSRALAKTWKPGDEVIVTKLDHDANVTPWVLAARDAGATVRFVGINPDDCTLRRDEFDRLLSDRTRLVALGCASNAVGTVNPVADLTARAHAAGALVFLDAVHYAPHVLIDVRAWDCDFLACSAYKFFGPHVGILWGKRRWLEALPAYKVRPASDRLPGRWMTGTQNHEGIAGVLAAVEYVADLGRRIEPSASGRRAALMAAFAAIRRSEQELGARLLAGLARLPGVRVRGITDPARWGERVPTVAIRHARHAPAAVAQHLAEKGVFVWHGNFYALSLIEELGLAPEGLVRIGLLHYNTAAEVDQLLEALAALG
jgi:cysteine desulfurase family protein (TIGR01976 family)